MAAPDTKQTPLITPSRQCSASSKPFEEGDRVVSCLFKADEGGSLMRMDMLEDEWANNAVPGTILGRWTRVFKSEHDPERHSAKQRMANAESLFVSMMGVAGGDGLQEPEVDALKHLLGLMLERKRILKPLGAVAQSAQRYRHVKTKAEYLVPWPELAPDSLVNIAQKLDELLGG
ncbi:MAG TPA: hypothetical protein PLV25_01590 [Opitutales bacterium]|nr:hypothetical protein [Opitutales bacterium]